MTSREFLTRSNGEDKRSSKGKRGGRVGWYHGYSVRVEGMAYGEKGLVSKSKNGVLDGGIPIEGNIGGVEVFVIDKFSC